MPMSSAHRAAGWACCAMCASVLPRCDEDSRSRASMEVGEVRVADGERSTDSPLGERQRGVGGGWIFEHDLEMNDLAADLGGILLAFERGEIPPNAALAAGEQPRAGVGLAQDRFDLA